MELGKVLSKLSDLPPELQAQLRENKIIHLEALTDTDDKIEYSDLIDTTSSIPSEAKKLRCYIKDENP